MHRRIKDLEQVFTYNGQKYVVEFNAEIDGADIYIDMLRLESISEDAILSVQVLETAEIEARRYAVQQLPEPLDYLP